MIDSIIDEFLERLHQQARTSADTCSANLGYEPSENLNLIFENGEIQEELIDNLYLIQAYSDVLHPDHFAKMTLGRDRYTFTENISLTTNAQ